MSIGPVIHRELRVASRRASTWFLRLAFPLGSAAALVFGLMMDDRGADPRGGVLLGCMAVVMFPVALLSGPFLTADAIGAERRQGTLDLLRLTRLSGAQIVEGKLVSHSLQAASSLVGAIPFLFIPVLAGGVTWGAVLRLIVVLLATLYLSLSIAIAWSARVADARRSVLASFVTLLLLNFVPWVGMLPASSSGSTFWLASRVATLPSPMSAATLALDSSFRRSWAAADRVFGGAEAFLMSLGLITALGLGAMHGAARCVSGRIEPLSEPPHPRSPSGAATDSTSPIRDPASSEFREALMRWNNPLASHASRALGPRQALTPVEGVTAAAVVIMLFSSAIGVRHGTGFITSVLLLYALHLMVRLRWCLGATTWLLELRQSGGLEMLLTTPVPENQLIRAHHESLRRHHRPSLLVLLALNFALALLVVVRREPLNMGSTTFRIFLILLVGGMLVTLADVKAIGWLGLRSSFQNGSRLQVFGRCFASLVTIPWAGLALLIITSFSPSENSMFSGLIVWMLATLAWDEEMTSACSEWMAPGPRQKAADLESPSLVSGTQVSPGDVR